MESMLKRTRERAGMTLEHAAKRLRISPGYLLQIENGHRGVGVPRAAQIAELYELGKEELFVPIRFAARFSKGGSM
ncbi:helix-turn-helix transcriptional regulator [Paenibacillus sp.]|uniref:helix-turn-helix domain-containing protein n=1 Tax=Paenibacillus sp. TaxID=58172 RepID=UPI002D4D40F8|nr:helix-turn-helix transcriptional regulator [Paenibacillus sp.]HZG57739.1 helix-turn-helix transcriptional regulator [Paenibacillus sp.]